MMREDPPWRRPGFGEKDSQGGKGRGGRKEEVIANWRETPFVGAMPFWEIQRYLFLVSYQKVPNPYLWQMPNALRLGLMRGM